jgi:hypothetical protein
MPESTMRNRKGPETLDGCGCLNCRLSRMENALDGMRKILEIHLGENITLPGMPDEGNKLKKK